MRTSHGISGWAGENGGIVLLYNGSTIGYNSMYMTKMFPTYSCSTVLSIPMHKLGVTHLNSIATNISLRLPNIFSQAASPKLGTVYQNKW